MLVKSWLVVGLSELAVELLTADVPSHHLYVNFRKLDDADEMHHVGVEDDDDDYVAMAMNYHLADYQLNRTAH